MSDWLSTADFAWKRVVVCGPHHVHPLDEPLVGATIMQVLLAKPASGDPAENPGIRVA